MLRVLFDDLQGDRREVRQGPAQVLSLLWGPSDVGLPKTQVFLTREEILSRCRRERGISSSSELANWCEAATGSRAAGGRGGVV